MIAQESANRIDTWLALSPLFYNRLLIFNAYTLKNISNVKWLRGALNNKKSTFSYDEGYLCLSGATERAIKANNFEGGFSIYKCSIPISVQLDDDRLKPILKLHSHWIFREEIDILEQYGIENEDQRVNNMFAISYKKSPTLNLISTRKLMEEANHQNQYAQDDKCSQFKSHTQPITSIKWANISSGGHKLFTSSDDCTIIQYDVEKINEERTLKYHKTSVKGITPIYDYSSFWSEGPCVNYPLNSLISVAVDGNIFIWDDRSPNPVNKINSKQKQLSAVESLSREMFVTGANDGSLKIWDLRNSREYLYDTKFQKSHGHIGRIKQIKANRYFSSQERMSRCNVNRIKFTTSGQDGKVIQWQEKLQFAHEGHQGASTFDLSDSFSLCASAEQKKNIFMLWEPGVRLGQSQS